MEGQLGKKSKKFLKAVIIKRTWDTLCLSKIYQVGKWAYQDIQVGHGVQHPPEHWVVKWFPRLTNSTGCWARVERTLPHTYKREWGKETNKHKNTTSLMVQWLRICLPMQGTCSSIPGPEGSHVPRSNQAQVQQLLSLHSRTSDQNKRSHCNEKPMHCN